MSTLPLDLAAPTPRHQTVRRRIIELLQTGEFTALEISKHCGLPEKEVPGHLEHIEKSLSAGGLILQVTPARCIECGYEFKKREHYSRPGRCFICKSSRIEGPWFRVAGDGS